MTPAGKPMLIDFDHSADRLRENKIFGGTLAYMPPEHLRAFLSDRPENHSLDDPRSDLFSLGVILFELLTGTHPLDPLPLKAPAPKLAELLLQRLSRGHQPVRQAN